MPDGAWAALQPEATPALEAVLRATDPDGLMRAVTALGGLDAGDAAAVARTLDAWDDEQAVSNLLLHPHLVERDRRAAALLRGLDEDGYAQVAAAVGAGSLPLGAWTTSERVALVQALLDVVARHADVAARRAASALRVLAHPADVEELVELLGHPDPVVRTNLQNAVLRRVSPRGLRDVLDEVADRAPEAAAAARTALRADGLDVDAGGPLPVPPPALSRVPSRAEWVHSRLRDADEEEL